MRADGRVERLGARLVGALMRAYPPRFRRRFGAEMRRTFLDRQRAAADRSGVRGLLGYWAVELAGGLAAAGAAWVTAARARTARVGGTRERRKERSMNGLRQDARYAARVLARSPGFTLIALSVLALGIGGNAAMFSVVRGVLLRPLEYGEADRLVWFYETNPERGWDRAEVAPANFLDWRERTTAFEEITAFQDWPEELTLVEGGEATSIRGIRVVGNFFSVLRAAPVLGRGFRPEETWAGNDAVVVVSHAFWTRRLGGDPGVVGETLVLDGVPRTVVGVMTPRFRTPEVVWTSPSALADPVDVWIPFGWTEAQRAAVFFRRAHVVQAVGRLRAGVGVDAASAELRAIAADLERAFPETNEGMGVGIERLHDAVVAHARLPLLVVMAATGLVLLIACANLANLLLVRMLDRGPQLAVRRALGASGGRIARQLLVESLMLAAVGGLAGVIVARVGVDFLVSLAPDDLPRVDRIAVDGTVLAFAALLALGTGVAVALLPALRGGRRELAGALRAGGRGGGGRRGARRASTGFVVAEVAVAVVLAAGAGLLLRTVYALEATPRGFETEDRVAVTVGLSERAYPDAVRITAFHRSLMERARGLPGVEAAGLTSRLPLEGGWRSDLSVDGVSRAAAVRGVLHREVGPGYFDAIDARIVAGRAIGEADHAEAPLAVVINRTLAERAFPRGGAVGRRVAFTGEPDADAAWYRVVGVVEDQAQEDLRNASGPEAFGSVLQTPRRTVNLVLHAGGEPSAAIGAARRIVRALDPAVPVVRATTLDAVSAATMSRERFLLGLVGVFAAFGLTLALLGVYGVTSQAVRRRTREIGIRSALGAAPAGLLRDVLGHGLSPVALGVAIGLVGALGAGRALSSYLFGVAPSDPATLAGVALLILAAGAVACWVPARRAVRVEPMRVLGAE